MPQLQRQFKMMSDDVNITTVDFVIRQCCHLQTVPQAATIHLHVGLHCSVNKRKYVRLLAALCARCICADADILCRHGHFQPVTAASCSRHCCCVTLQVSNIRRLMKAVRDIEATPRQHRHTFLLDFEVLDGPFWCVMTLP